MTANCPHPCCLSLASVSYSPKSFSSFNTSPYFLLLPLTPCSPSESGSQREIRTGAVLITAVSSMPTGLGMQQVLNKCLGRGSASFVPGHPSPPHPPALRLEGGTRRPSHQKGRGAPCSLTKADPRRGGHQEMEVGSRGQRQSHGGGQRSETPNPQGLGYATPENHARDRDQRSREGGDLPAPPGPHPALGSGCLPS